MHGYPQRERGRALRGVKAEDTKRGNSFHRINAVAAVTHGRDGTKKLAPERYNGSMAGGRFERRFEHNPLPRIKKGYTTVMDRARFHGKKRLETIRKKANVHTLFLPAHSPDFNPIEKDWANMKRALRDTAPVCDLLQTAVYNYWR
jgi:hypothetical protein